MTSNRDLLVQRVARKLAAVMEAEADFMQTQSLATDKEILSILESAAEFALHHCGF